jgi:arylsulfatase
MPEKLAEMREIFSIEAARNSALPIGGGLWVPVYHPELRITPPYQEWDFGGPITRMPEFCAPALGNKNNIVSMHVVLPEKAEGVLYKLGGAGGGLTCFIDDGYLCYEYNLFIIMRTKIRSDQKLPVGDTVIEIETAYTGGAMKPAGALDITMRVGGKPFGKGNVPISAPLLFTANDCLDFGTALGSPVSMDYYERAPFAFNGTIERVHVRYTDA